MDNLVLDTNVLVSALWSPNGNPAKIVELVLYGEARIYLSNSIFDEYKNVLNRPRLNFKPEHIKNLLDGLFDCGNFINAKISKIALPDESDRKFYDVTKVSNSLLVTGNKKHFPNESFIMLPTEYLEMKRLF